MKIDPITMLLSDFQGQEQNIYDDIKIMILNGKISNLVQTLLDIWSKECGLNDTHRLLTMTTAFPQRVLLSLLESGFQPKIPLIHACYDTECLQNDNFRAYNCLRWRTAGRCQQFKGNSDD